MQWISINLAIRGSYSTQHPAPRTHPWPRIPQSSTFHPIPAHGCDRNVDSYHTDPVFASSASPTAARVPGRYRVYRRAQPLFTPRSRRGRAGDRPAAGFGRPSDDLFSDTQTPSFLCPARIRGRHDRHTLCREHPGACPRIVPHRSARDLDETMRVPAPVADIEWGATTTGRRVFQAF